MVGVLGSNPSVDTKNRNPLKGLRFLLYVHPPIEQWEGDIILCVLNQMLDMFFAVTR